LGQLVGGELSDLDRAVRAFEMALEVDGTFEEAQLALEQVLANARRWTRVDDAYQWIISRMGNGSDTHAARMRWWRKLGELRLGVLHQPDAARDALRVGAEGSPLDADVQELYADLAAQSPAHEVGAIEAYRRALLGTERFPHVCRALTHLFIRRKDRDTTL